MRLHGDGGASPVKKPFPPLALHQRVGVDQERRLARPRAWYFFLLFTQKRALFGSRTRRRASRDPDAMRQRISELLQIVRRAGMQIRLDRDDVDGCSLEVNTFKYLELVVLHRPTWSQSTCRIFSFSSMFWPVVHVRFVTVAWSRRMRAFQLLLVVNTPDLVEPGPAVLDPLDRLWRSTQTVVVDFAGAAIVPIILNVGSGRLDAHTSRLCTGIQEITFGSV